MSLWFTNWHAELVEIERAKYHHAGSEYGLKGEDGERPGNAP